MTDQYTKAAEYIDRILKGAKPAHFRVQAPTKFHLQQLANEIIE